MGVEIVAALDLKMGNMRKIVLIHYTSYDLLAFYVQILVQALFLDVMMEIHLVYLCLCSNLGSVLVLESAKVK